MHPEKKFKGLGATLLMLAGLLPVTASAEIVSRSEPISIEADSAELQDSLSTYTGNVKVVQGGVTMQGGRLIVRRASGNNFTFTLSGNPAVIHQVAAKAGDPDVRGRASRIDYASGNETLELRGNAVIMRGTERIAGGDIRYSFRERRTVVNNRGSGGGRVQITLQPGEDDKPGNNGNNQNGDEAGQ